MPVPTISVLDLQNLRCDSQDCEWCPEGQDGDSISPDLPLACHCGWMHTCYDTHHNPDWARHMIPWLTSTQDHDPDCSSTQGPKAHDCDCGACVSKRTLLLELGWDGKFTSWLEHNLPQD